MRNSPAFMSDSFLLENGTAATLYGTARKLPIFDYHCHLSPKEILEDRVFHNLTAIWLESDHYKWRLMRAAGLPEDCITGKAQDYDKFAAFCGILPAFIGNPVYEWAHLELKKYFGIAAPICAASAQGIWAQTQEAMADGSFSARSLITRSGVEAVITTDDPADSLEFHRQLAAQNLPFSVTPCFRLDNVLNIESPDFYIYLERLAASDGGAGTINNYDDLLGLLERRLDCFISHGCHAADVSFTDFPVPHAFSAQAGRAAQKGTVPGLEADASSAFSAASRGRQPAGIQCEAYRFCLLRDLACIFNRKNIVFQMHTGVIRNCSIKLLTRYGCDAGGDSIGPAATIDAARALLDSIDACGGLPRTIIYTLNHSSYYPLATLLGDFQGGSGDRDKGRGRLQLGAAWWFMDHRAGIREQLEAAAATGGLGFFNGMLTDSRSFLSYARHDYFRRVLCSFIGEQVERGSYPDDPDVLDPLVEDICYRNAERFFSGVED